MPKWLIVKKYEENPHGYYTAFSECVAIETLEVSIFATYDGLGIGGAVQYREDLHTAPTSCNLPKNQAN